MGGMLHLMEFESQEDKEAIIESQWLLRWFLEVRNINDSCAPLWRETTVTIFGVPLAAWCYESFHKIGCIYGRVTSVDYSRYDYAKISLITDCLFKINNVLLFDNEDKRFRIFVSEDNINVNNPITKKKPVKQ